MKLFYDTNIIVDIVSKRSGYEESFKVLELTDTGYVSTISITDVMYILRKYNKQNKVSDILQKLISILTVAVVTQDDLMYGFSGAMNDFEDAVQSSCAKRIGVDYIITRNVKDFTASPIPAITPDKFLERWEDEEG
ncbi:twitching motility protein PilT [Spirochaetia bacterium]|nr:twitching motility protein PilT [Spirochaetia bacterium]